MIHRIQNSFRSILTNEGTERQKRKPLTFGQRVLEVVKSCDMYGVPIQITFKGKNNYQSLPGSLISIVVIALFLIYAQR